MAKRQYIKSIRRRERFTRSVWSTSTCFFTSEGGRSAGLTSRMSGRNQKRQSIYLHICGNRGNSQLFGAASETSVTTSLVISRVGRFRQITTAGEGQPDQ